MRFLSRFPFKSVNLNLIINGAVVILGLYLVSFQSTICQAVGASIIAGAILSFFNMWFQYATQLESKLLDNIIEAGLIEAHKKRDLDVYDELVKHFKSIDVVGYSLRGFSESHLSTITKLCKGNNQLKVRILVVDPDSDYSKDREQIEKYPQNTFRTSIEKINTDIAGISNIELRKKAFHLSTMIFRIDDIMFVGPHLYTQPSKPTTTLELKSSGWLFDVYNDEFDKLWETAIPGNRGDGCS